MVYKLYDCLALRTRGEYKIVNGFCALHKFMIIVIPTDHTITILNSVILTSFP